MVEGWEVPIVGRQPATEFPNPLDWIEFGTVWRQEHEREQLAVRVQPRLEHSSVVVLGVVKHQDEALATGAMFEQAHQEAPEGLAVEYRFKGGDQFAGADVGRAEARHGLARGRMQEDGVFVFRRDPHTAAGAVLLEVAFVGTP